MYEVRERKDLENVFVLNNSSDNLITDDFLEEENAYEQIGERLQIQVLELSYLPENINFYELTLVENKGRMLFLDENKAPLFFYQGLSDKPTSLSYSSDMTEYKKIYNSFLDEEIMIYKNELGAGEVEFSIRLIHEHQYYFLQGNIDGIEFARIVEGIKIYAKKN